VVAALVLAVTAGCARNDGTAPLRAERVAAAQPEGTTGCRTATQGGGTTLGKPVDPSLTHECDLAPGSDPGRVLADTLDLATGDGWTKGDPPPSGGAWLLTKATMELQVSIQDARLVLVLVDHHR
jgi:hypothetical protein